jgi:hypothetical protein
MIQWARASAAYEASEKLQHFGRTLQTLSADLHLRLDGAVVLYWLYSDETGLGMQ